MVKYEFGNGRFIKQFDDKNWCVGQAMVKKDGDNVGEEYDKIIAYHPTLTGAKKAAFRIFSLQAGSHKELEDLVEKIKVIN